MKKETKVTFHAALKMLKNKDVEYFDNLINDGCELADLSSRLGYTLLMASIVMGNDEITKKLITNSKNINRTDYCGTSALIFAVNENNLNIVEDLVKNGANVNLSNDDKKLPLAFSLENGEYSVSKYLIDNGSCTKASDIRNKSLVDYASKTNDFRVINLINVAQNTISEDEQER